MIAIRVNMRATPIVSPRPAVTGIVDETISHLVDDSVQVADKGKGHFLLAWSHYVQSKGHYPSVRSVILG